LTDRAPKESLSADVVKSLGLVFGDIGTSPIYTLSVVFLMTRRPTPEHVIGVLSLIVWTLEILVTVEYAWLAMSLGERGEGGTIVLKTILVRLLKRSRQAAFVTLLSLIITSGLNTYFTPSTKKSPDRSKAWMGCIH